MDVPWRLLSPDDREDIEERAGILEFYAGLTRDEAEKRAFELVVARIDREADTAGRMVDHE